AAAWPEITAWAEADPVWQFADNRPAYEVRELWRTLLGFDGEIRAAFGAMPSAVIAGMQAFYDRWAAHDLSDRTSAQRFINFLRVPAALPLLTPGLVWLDRAFDRPPDQRWGFRELAPEIAEFLLWVWLQHEKKVRADMPSFAAFRRLLLRLCAEQDQTALALQAMLTDSPPP